MLIDDVTITIQGGNGGNGAATFLHNAGQYKGGSNGGNGGNGGNVYVQGTDDLTALQQFQYKKKIKADDGIGGKHKNLYGKNAEDLIIRVPLGTRITILDKDGFRIKSTVTTVYEIENLHDKFLLAKGGVGGRGNNSFKSATNQAPRFAEDGTNGEEKQVRFELRLIADIGLIGLPNAGKSSLLSVLTNAHPKIANYPFTTLEPNLGVMDGIIIADIPGLITGASIGRGLGFQFLKHIEKTKILVHCIDVANDDLLQIYETVRTEFKQYSENLFEKREIIFLTKIDLVTEKEIKIKIKQLEKLKKEIYLVSVYEEKSLEKVKETLRQNL